MIKICFQSLLGVCTTFFLLCSCGGNESGRQFATKQDSLAFAKAVMEKYPAAEEKIVGPDTTAPVKGRTFQAGGMEPISWETVKKYSAGYDKYQPIKSPSGQGYKGFSIDSAGYNMLLQNKLIKGLYLRLGRKDDGSYTIMILGLDDKGNIITTKGNANNPDDTNFDQLPPCPTDCPTEEPL